MKIEEFVKGKKPECVAPRYKHTKVAGMGIKKPYCLWCEKLLQ